jgi:hypothetical protein
MASEDKKVAEGTWLFPYAAVVILVLPARSEISTSFRAASWTDSTVAAISGKKLSNLASIDVGVQIAISHFSQHRQFFPLWS